MDIDTILHQVAEYAPHFVTVTGGEPLAQKNALRLLTALCDAGYDVSLETSGALDISGVDPRVSRIMDIKTPGSGEVAKNNWKNLDYLTRHDEIKFVIVDTVDYDWARSLLQEYQLTQRCPVLFSPVHGQIQPGQLADWVLRDRLPVRLQVQLHKIFWGEVAGR